MNALIRFCTCGKRGKKNKEAPSYNYAGEVMGASKTRKTKKSDLECRVSFLDGTAHTFFIPKNSMASVLYEHSFLHIGINDDKDYFGITYRKDLTIWLDPTKSVTHQCKSKSPYAVALRVKFFSSDPTSLQDEYTRYLFTLQLRDDIQSGKLACLDLHLAAELSALLLQAEFGDYDPKQHTLAFVSTFRFLPEKQQTPDFEAAVLHQYKLLRDRNMTPADADAQYLSRVRSLPDYGVDMHRVTGKDGQEYSLGLTPAGILVYEGQKKIGLFLWRDVNKLEMRGKHLKILVSEEDASSRKVVEHAFCFVLSTKEACKQLWKSAVEHHCFFRLIDHIKPPPKRSGLFRLRSSFSASLKNTEFQLHNANPFGSSSYRKSKSSTRSAPGTPTPSRGSGSPDLPSGTAVKTTSFRRVPSKRITPRQNYSKRGQLANVQPPRSSGKIPRDSDDQSDASNSPNQFVTTANVESKNGSSPKRFTWRNQPPNYVPGSQGATPELLLRRVGKHQHDQNQQVAVTPPTERITPLLPRMGYEQRNNGPPAPRAPYLDTVV